MFKIGDEVRIISDGSVGIIKGIRKFDEFCVYEILVNSKTQSFFESQIEKQKSLVDNNVSCKCWGSKSKNYTNSFKKHR